MVSVTPYWLAVGAFLVGGAVALVRPKVILDIRGRFRPPQNADAKGRRRSFGPREVRICGAALLIIDVALIWRLVA